MERYEGITLSFEKAYEAFLNKRILTDFVGFGKKTKGFLQKVYEIFGGEMPSERYPYLIVERLQLQRSLF